MQSVDRQRNSQYKSYDLKERAGNLLEKDQELTAEVQ